MTRRTKKRVAFVSSYFPRRCGIATFTSDLVTATSKAMDGLISPLVVAMRSDCDTVYEEPVKFEIRQNVKEDYANAADYINFSQVDCVSLQHEFGLFGGEAGSHLVQLIKRLNAPTITTLHTVLNEPSSAYKKSLLEVCQFSQRVVTMNERGVNMLRDVYGISDEILQLIPHGIPDLPFVDSNYYKNMFGLEGRKTILTFGLLSQNKGIETVLEALPAVVTVDPSVMYIVLGMTHPNVLRHDGEAYRFRLQHQVQDLGLENNVVFYNRFVEDDELHNFLCATDIYVTPYLNEEQLTSGTLSFAVGTGKAVISTPYWAACELLADKRGLLVPFGDPDALSNSIISILEDDQVVYSLRRHAYDYGRTRTWPKIGEVYSQLFCSLGSSAAFVSCKSVGIPEAMSAHELPVVSLDHLARLTDDTGLFQHARYSIPDRKHGYCTDDNARAVIVLIRYYSKYAESRARRLLEIYLSFVLHSIEEDGSVHNFMRYDQSWVEPEPPNDAFGRVLWALGALISGAPASSYVPIAKECFDSCINHIQVQSPRGLAYSIIGMCGYLKQFSGASEIKRNIQMAVDQLLSQYEANSHPQWRWFEGQFTYDNGILPQALFSAGAVLSNQKCIDVATATCDFLVDNITGREHYSFIGCNGWYSHGQKRATYDQQPIEAASVILMLKAAYAATGKTYYLIIQRRVFDWFLGANDRHVSVYDTRTQGCYDGLTSGGVNENQGAESLLAFLISLLEVGDNVALLEEDKKRV